MRKNKFKNYWKAIGVASLFLTSCNLEKNIDLDLPNEAGEIMVECYLEPGKPYRALITETVPYYQISQIPPFLENATVTISHNGVTDTLINFLFPDLETEKIYNYYGAKNVPENDYNTEFLLEIRDSNGRYAKATAQILRPVKIDTMTWKFDDEGRKAYILTTFYDAPSQKNYYRFFRHKDSLKSSKLKTDFTFNDDNFNGDSISFGSGFDFKDKDTIINTLFHIEQSYHDFIESANDAASANGNPFGQPSALRSNIVGGRGIFASLSFYRDTIYIKK